MMYLITKTYINTLNIERSEFIAVILPISDKNEVPLIIKNIRKEYPKATHYTYAYIIGENADTASSNDDGEPAGTAGIPILEVLNKNNMTNIICVVIRYFGGIKLGVGGLIRAYRDSCVQVLNSADIYESKLIYIYQSVFDYSQIDLMNKLIDKNNILETQFLQKVTYLFFLEYPNLDFLEEYQHLISTEFIKTDKRLFKNK